MATSNARGADVAALLNPYPVTGELPDDARLTDDLLRPLGKGGRWWSALVAITGLGTLYLFTMVTYAFVTGIGVFGNNIPVAWAFPIINFVWWIGIGHAGTFISAILLLFEQRWRTSINRFAEAMTLFAVVQAGLYPLLHMGRPWFGYWLTPYPATMAVWPNFKSALAWDIAAISTYGLVSLLFWYLGLIPDLAVVRDRTTSRAKRIVYGVFALGWRGAGRHWSHYRQAYYLLAGLATPLVISVHSIVSLDFSMTLVPGWRATIFPPYFVAGAVFSGFAMVLTLLIPSRKIFGLEPVVTLRHLDNMAKVVLATGSIVAYSYLVEHFTAWYTGSQFEYFMFFSNRPMGIYAPFYWTMMVCNVLVPQLLWFQKMRTHTVALFVISILVNVGMWMERFVIIVTSLEKEFLPSGWFEYWPSWVDWSVFAGTLCFFLFLFLLFIRFLPFIPIMEIKEMRAELDHEAHAAAGDHARPADGGR